MNQDHIEKKNELSFELPPELAAVEAGLAAAKPHAVGPAQERVKAAALLEVCRDAVPETSNLIEMILNTDERRITVSLREYLKAERFRAGAIGVVIGLILGVVLNLSGMLILLMLKNL